MMDAGDIDVCKYIEKTSRMAARLRAATGRSTRPTRARSSPRSPRYARPSRAIRSFDIELAKLHNKRSNPKTWNKENLGTLLFMLEEIGENIVKQGWDVQLTLQSGMNPGCQEGLCPHGSEGASKLCSAVYRAEADLREYAIWAATYRGQMPMSIVSGEKINGRVLLNRIVRLKEMLGDNQRGVTCKQRICQSVPVQRPAAVDPESETASDAHMTGSERPRFVAQRVPQPQQGAVGGRRRRHRTRRRVRRKRRKTRAERRSRSRRRKTRRKK